MNFVEKIDDNVKIERVLISVYDKGGLTALVPELLRINPEVVLYSTGGTHRVIAEILMITGQAQHIMDPQCCGAQ